MAATRVRGKSRSGVECGLPGMTWPLGLSASCHGRRRDLQGGPYPSLWMDMLLIIAGGREREVFLNGIPTGKVPVLPNDPIGPPKITMIS